MVGCDDKELKLKVLKDLMDHMRSKDGSKLKPKAVEVSVEEKPLEEKLSMEKSPEEFAEKGGSEEMSPEDLEKVMELYRSLNS